jgi:hypothetical protein
MLRLITPTFRSEHDPSKPISVLVEAPILPDLESLYPIELLPVSDRPIDQRADFENAHVRARALDRILGFRATVVRRSHDNRPETVDRYFDGRIGVKVFAFLGGNLKSPQQEIDFLNTTSSNFVWEPVWPPADLPSENAAILLAEALLRRPDYGGYRDSSGMIVHLTGDHEPGVPLNRRSSCSFS